MAAFNQSTHGTMKNMWSFMLQHKNDVFVRSTQEGIEKVRRSKGRIPDTRVLLHISALLFSRTLCLFSRVHHERICQRTYAM